MSASASTFRSARVATALAVAATIGVVGSLVTSLAVSSLFEARLRAQSAETHIAIPTSPASTQLPPLDHSAWDALPAPKPIEVDPSSFGEHDFPRIAPALKDVDVVQAWPCPADPTSTIVLSRAQVDDMLTALEAPTTSCSIVPAFEGGRVTGFKVFGVRPGSFGARLCLQNGDVVTRVNDRDVTSPEVAFALLKDVREATRVDVELRRKGEPMRVSYVIQ